MPKDNPPAFSGVQPHLAQVADLGPPRSECGVGCLMPWAGKLYVLNYVSHRKDTGRGTSLRVIDPDMNMHMVEEARGVDGTYTNRFIHFPSNRLIIGPHVIDADHRIHTVDELVDIRVCGTTWHLSDPEHLVYVLGMEGELFELNPRTLECRQVMDLQQCLDTQGEFMVHFKDCYCHLGRLVVCSNEYFEEDWAGRRCQGRLAEWDGKKWTIIERRPFVAIYGRGAFAPTIFATGWDQASAILSVYTKHTGQWTRYRLPKASHCFDHKWQTEWPRMRETEHERILMDAHGMFYELSPHAYGGRVWGVRPVSTHLWVLGDFCTWRGLLVMGADNASPSSGDSCTTAEPQSGLWMGKTDDLWRFGAPAGWGGPWWNTLVNAREPSDPYLMTGFRNKCIHISHDAGSEVDFDIEVDFMGHGSFEKYMTLRTGRYANHAFPTGFGAHWIRLIPSRACTASAQLHYT